MRIWILNHYASPPDQPAGTRHYDFGRVLASQGHDVTIFASSFCHFSRREERLRPGERIRAEYVDGVRFVWIRTTSYTGNDHRRLLNMMSYALGVLVAQRRFRRPDVVVGSSVHLAAVGAALLIGKLRRVPFVFEVRDLWPRALIDMGALRERGAAARLLTMLERFLYRRADLVICLLPLATDYLLGCGVPADKIIYVPNGIADYDLDGRPPGRAAAAVAQRIRQQRESGCLVAGYVGSHGHINGVDFLVETARELRERGEEQIAIVFVGEGSEKERCQRLSRAYDLANISFWPPVPKYAVPAVLDALDVTLFALRDPSIFKYGLSCNKLFDYLASGRPVVSACAIADCPVSVSGGGMCVPSQSPGAMAGALQQMAELGEAGRHALGAHGRNWVYQEHGATALAGRFLEALSRARR